MEYKLKKAFESLINSATVIKQAAHINLSTLRILYSAINSKLTKEESNVLKASIENLEGIENMVGMDKDLLKQTSKWHKINEELKEKNKEIFLFKIEDKQLN
jgi:hypothetical protein